MDFTDPARKTLLISRHESPNIYRSVDGGQTWTDLSASLPAGINFATGPYVVNAQTYLLGIKSGPESGTIRTTDGGKTWAPVHQGGVLGQPLVSKPDGALYWVLESGGVIKSTDKGATWTQVTRNGTISPVASTLVQLPNGTLAAVGNQVVIVSADQGTTWHPVSAGMPHAPAGVAYSPYRNAFYMWHFDCVPSAHAPIPADAIMRASFDYRKG